MAHEIVLMLFLTFLLFIALMIHSVDSMNDERDPIPLVLYVALGLVAIIVVSMYFDEKTALNCDKSLVVNDVRYIAEDCVDASVNR